MSRYPGSFWRTAVLYFVLGVTRSSICMELIFRLFFAYTVLQSVLTAENSSNLFLSDLLHLFLLSTYHHKFFHAFLIDLPHLSVLCTYHYTFFYLIFDLPHFALCSYLHKVFCLHWDDIQVLLIITIHFCVLYLPTNNSSTYFFLTCHAPLHCVLTVISTPDFPHHFSLLLHPKFLFTYRIHLHFVLTIKNSFTY